MDSYIAFMNKLQQMNKKLLERVKATEKQTHLVSSKEKVIKKLDELEQKILLTKENKLLNSSSMLSSTVQTDRRGSDSVLKE